MVLPTSAQALSQIGVAVRRNRPEAERLARQDFAAAKIIERSRRTLADAPPLTDDQKAVLVAAFRDLVVGVE